MDKIRKLSDPDFNLKLQKLINENKLDEFFEQMYEALVEDIDESVREIAETDDKTRAKRLRQVEALIRRFVELEQYEKCAPLNVIVKRACPINK